jgi:hypothetical protein
MFQRSKGGNEANKKCQGDAAMSKMRRSGNGRFRVFHPITILANNFVKGDGATDPSSEELNYSWNPNFVYFYHFDARRVTRFFLFRLNEPLETKRAGTKRA